MSDEREVSLRDDFFNRSLRSHASSGDEALCAAKDEKTTRAHSPFPHFPFPIHHFPLLTQKKMYGDIFPYIFFAL